MSRYTEYVVWQSSDNSWGIATYLSYETGDIDSPDFDEEWDREWDYSAFAWASTGHHSEEAARRQLTPNPGHGGDKALHSEDPEQAAQLDLLARILKDPAFAKQHRLEKDKETVAKKHEAIRDNLEKNNGYNGQFITVVFGSSTEAVASGLGMFTSKDGYVKKNKNGWLTVADREFYNPNTGEVNELVSAVKKPQAYRPGF